MELLLKCLPDGDLPYDNIKSATRMMVKLFEQSPYLPNFPLLSPNENLLYRTLSNVPGVKYKNGFFWITSSLVKFKKYLNIINNEFNNVATEGYPFDSFFLERFLQFIERVKPKEAVVYFLGPMTIASHFEHSSRYIQTSLLEDNIYRMFIIQLCALKAIWIINQINRLSQHTKPIIIFDDEDLSQAGMLKKDSDIITNELLTSIYSKLIAKLHNYNAAVGIKCFKKCNWQIPMEAGADIISFDAYNNPDNLNIIPTTVQKYLAGGGYINWGIIPVVSEASVKKLNINNVSKRFIKTITPLIDRRISESCLYKNSAVSVQGNLDHLPVIFAEKALILSTQLLKKHSEIIQHNLQQ